MVDDSLRLPAYERRTNTEQRNGNEHVHQLGLIDKNARWSWEADFKS
jgi:hypothetical protein